MFPEERGPPADEEHVLLLCRRPHVLGGGLGLHQGGGRPLLSLQRLGRVLLRAGHVGGLAGPLRLTDSDVRSLVDEDLAKGESTGRMAP